MPIPDPCYLHELEDADLEALAEADRSQNLRSWRYLARGPWRDVRMTELHRQAVARDRLRRREERRQQPSRDRQAWRARALCPPTTVREAKPGEIAALCEATGADEPSPDHRFTASEIDIIRRYCERRATGAARVDMAMLAPTPKPHETGDASPMIDWMTASPEEIRRAGEAFHPGDENSPLHPDRVAEAASTLGLGRGAIPPLDDRATVLAAARNLAFREAVQEAAERTLEYRSVVEMAERHGGDPLRHGDGSTEDPAVRATAAGSGLPPEIVSDVARLGASSPEIREEAERRGFEPSTLTDDDTLEDLRTSILSRLAVEHGRTRREAEADAIVLRGEFDSLARERERLAALNIPSPHQSARLRFVGARLREILAKIQGTPAAPEPEAVRAAGLA